MSTIKGLRFYQRYHIKKEKPTTLPAMLDRLISQSRKQETLNKLDKNY